MIMFLLFPTVGYAHSNSAIHWGIPSAKEERVPYPGDPWHNLLTKYDGVYIGNTSKKEVYLTFDNGYENGFTPKILDVLKEKKVLATFFITGQFIKENPDLVKRMVDEGHIVGNHTWHHPNLTTVNNVRLEKELTLLKDEFKQLTGKDEMTYMRPPEGVFSERTLAVTKKLGYRHIMWSLAFLDWKVEEQHGWKYSYDNVMRKIHPGAVILLHTISSDNAHALGSIIDGVREKGYEFKSLDDLLKPEKKQEKKEKRKKKKGKRKKRNP
nr:delta-lactam-biosynthetic de-N-acetylase [Priestia taiwanensis]